MSTNPTYFDPADPIRSFNAVAAWHTLSPQAREMIGAMVAEMVFADFVEQDFCNGPLWFGEATRGEAYNRSFFLLGAISHTIEQQMPELFGTDENPPKWPDEFEARTDREIADAAIRGIRHVLAPASELSAN